MSQHDQKVNRGIVTQILNKAEAHISEQQRQKQTKKF